MSYYVRTKNDLDMLGSDFFKSIFNDSNSNRLYKNVMKTDVLENESNYELSIEMPGYSKENILITLDKGYLTIEGTLKKENEKENTNYLRRERYVGTCSRSFYLGEEYKDENIKASFENGLLKLYIDKDVKKEEQAKKTIMIN